jgi:hypothetical protein
MRRSTKVKVVAARIPIRKSAAAAAGASRRSFPAWIDAGDRGVSFSAIKSVTPRVRDALVLRVVSKGRRSSSDRKSSHGAGAR